MEKQGGETVEIKVPITYEGGETVEITAPITREGKTVEITVDVQRVER